jgi:hypothetical protein
MKKLISKSRFWRIVGLLAVDAFIFGLSDPHRVPSFMLAVGFVLLVITTYQIILALLLVAGWYGLPGAAHRRRQARVLTGVTGGVVALQSMGELVVRDISVLLPLALLAYLYISYGKSKSAPAQSQGRGQSAPLFSVD